MPAVDVLVGIVRGRLHEGNTLALDRVCNEERGLVRVLRGCKRPLDRAEVVAVEAVNVPAERLDNRFEISEAHDGADRTIRLPPVVVHDDGKVTHILMHRGAQRFVVLSFLQLAITGEHEDAPSFAEAALSPYHPPPLRDPHAKPSGIRLDPGNVHLRTT